jgi:ferredoxin
LAAPVPDSVRYAPGDCALLVGPAESLLKRLEAVRLTGLRPALLCTDFPDLDSLPRGLRALSGELADVSGWMGTFRARTKGRDGAVDLAPLSFHEDGHFDWVLDFSASARSQVPPPGYYTLATDDFPTLKMALLEIAGRLRGGYEKPRYFDFTESLCAHRRQEVPGCQACLSVCPAGAISAGKESIRIEPHLCQGCGTCALVCPSGAVRYAHPGPGFSLTRLQAALSAWREAGGGPVGVWITGPAQAEEIPEGWLPQVVDEAANLGLEFWLAALVSGANRVAIAAGAVPTQTRRALEEQIGVGRAILAGLGWPTALGLVDTAEALANLSESLPAMPPMEPAALPVSDEKRQLLFAAIDALAGGGRADAVDFALPAAAPMGDVRIAADKCTLCAACVRICPTGALSLPGTTSQLAFTEQQCLQCGLCLNVCPEKAVTLAPRLLVSIGARRAPRVVAQADMFACNGCGTPFASRAMIERSRAIMADHPMFQGNQVRLMTLCPVCRQKAMAGVPE